jgi:hypothetical protein
MRHSQTESLTIVRDNPIGIHYDCHPSFVAHLLLVKNDIAGNRIPT